ncbi:MAG: hypothetical protein GF333_00625 [Candidatus Omnitrophica bacterium]|nr:hypothetical protein [Candidatus Omnitrophota bacterium]
MTGKDFHMDRITEMNRDRFLRLQNFMDQGVRIEDPFTTYIAEDVVIGKGTVIYPLTVIEKDVRIGENCSVGPFARLRPGTRLQDGAGIGNFVEVVRSTVASGSKAKHLTYLGDAEIEEDVNIGAGTIVANYDGTHKHKTTVRKGAFIGSGSILVAPVVIGKNACTGAGAVVTRNRDVPDDAVVVGVPARIHKK